MTKTEAKPAIAAVNELLAKSPDGLREIVRVVMQETLEAETTEAAGAEKRERAFTPKRSAFRPSARAKIFRTTWASSSSVTRTFLSLAPRLSAIRVL
jgi:transposase-like protein